MPLTLQEVINNLRPQFSRFKEAIDRSLDEGREIGYIIDNKYRLTGPFIGSAKGVAYNLTKEELENMVAIGAFHTHIQREKPVPSRLDEMWMTLRGDKILCVGGKARERYYLYVGLRKEVLPSGKVMIDETTIPISGVGGIYQKDVLSTEKKPEIPKTRVSSLGFQELELPVAKAVEALVNENPWSSGFHGVLNQRWTIVFRGKVSDRAVKAAEIAGLEVTYREAPKGSGQILTDVSLPDVGVTEIEKATEVFNRFAELYEGLRGKYYYREESQAKRAKSYAEGLGYRASLQYRNGKWELTIYSGFDETQGTSPSVYPFVLERLPINAVIRTSPKYDLIVKHLGYEPVSLEETTSLGSAGLIPTDVDLVKECQKRLAGVKVIGDEFLTPIQKASLNLGRAINKDILHERVRPLVLAAEIPPASKRVRTAGMYGKTTHTIYISTEQLERGRSTIDTEIHELAHHTSGAEDGEPAHQEEMKRIAGVVVERVTGGIYDDYLRQPAFQY